MGTEPRGDLTTISARLAAAALEARERLVRAIYAGLRRIAGGLMHHERPGHTRQPGAMVHEAVLRLLRRRRPWPTSPTAAISSRPRQARGYARPPAQADTADRQSFSGRDHKGLRR